MAPVNPHFKGKPSFKGRNPKRRNTDSHNSAVSKKKKTWNPENKFFQGSLQEGKGFAFQRKQKVQQEYKKLLRKEKWRMKDSKPKLEDEYPEHLRHLYMAERQKMNEEEQLNKDRRRKGRSGDVGEEEEQSTFASSVARTSETGSPEKSAASLNEGPQTSQFESSGQDQFKKKKWKKMSSNQKMIEEYKRQKEERERKREIFVFCFRNTRKTKHREKRL
ncbi:thyroid transcription factor 1-associated protein 26 homolog isoform X4 [Hemibagrus wyckioides]|uniref:thyroid transcription factor 1-associated protein 26 homolog isoform X4 n=1 Tax=Hemibagrus wyckioides TaxID=337641 RepID=UPI00266BCA6F|nr:thyroid transcription factor 1-associated protein 26 homolog isoform X4 [Hemibagrus wyckioides]